LFYEVLLLPARMAWSAAASVMELPSRMLTSSPDGRPGNPAHRTRSASVSAGDGSSSVSGDAESWSEGAVSARRPPHVSDDPRTLSSAHHRAHVLRSGGDYEEAQRVDEDTLVRRRRVLGDDHPDTLSSAHNLAVDLSALGEHGRARILAEDTLARRRRVLGDDHPRALSSAHNLARVLSRMAHDRA